MSLATALTGLLMCVLGFTHAGRAIRFLPYPVIGGFLGATGWLMVTGAIQVVTDQHATLANLGAFADAMIAAKLAAGAAVAVVLHVLLRRIEKPIRPARRAAGVVRGHAPRPAVERHVDRRGASERLDVPSATRSRALPAVENGSATRLSLGRIAVASPATCSP